MAKTPYHEMLAHNAFLKRKFILHGADNSEMTLLTPSRAIGISKDGFIPSISELGTITTPTLLEKKLVYSAPNSSAKLCVVNQDGLYQTTVYLTTAQKLKQALRNGVFNAEGIQDPLAKMIAQIGGYKRTVFERSTELQLRVRENEKRLAVADWAQTFIELLQPLNQSVNNYKFVKTPGENLKTIINKIDELDSELEKIIKELHGKTEDPYPTLLDCACLISDETQEYRKLVTAIKNPTEEQIKDLLASHGASDQLLKYFLQQQINTITQTAINADYSVTGLYQDASGLSQALLDAQYTGEGYSSELTDYHNPVSKEHGFDFSAKENENLVAIDLGEYGFNPKSNVDLAKRIALISRTEEGKKLYADSDDTVRFVNFRGEKGTIPGYTLVKKVGFVLVNSIIDISTFVLDLSYSIFFVAASLTNTVLKFFDRNPFKIPAFPSEQSFLQKWDTAESTYKKLESTKALLGDPPLTRINKPGFFVRGFHLIRQQIINITLNPIGEVVKGVTVHFWEGIQDIYYDIAISRNPINEAEILDLLSKRLHEDKKIAELHQEKIEALLKPQGISYENESFDEYGEASPDYHLNPDKPEDFLSWASNEFAKDLTEFFSKEIYRGHPIGGVAFTVAACSAAPMLMPHLAHLPFFHFIYTKLDIPIAKALVGETHGLMSTFSTAMIEGKAGFLMADLANGRSSLGIRALEGMIENPVLATVVGTATVTLGFEIAFKANIPWLSQEIAAEAEKAIFPYFELGLSGAKLAAIVIESGIRFSEDHEPTHGEETYLDDQISQSHSAISRIERLRGEIKEAITAGYKKVKKIEHITVDDEKQIEHQTTEYLDAFKKALHPNSSNSMAKSLAGAIAVCAAAEQTARSSTHNSQFLASKSREHFDRIRIRQQILQIDPDSLPRDEKYKIMLYVNTHYAKNPEYVAAVKYKLMGGREKIGGLAGSIKMALSYIPATIRATIALAISARYALEALFDPKLAESARLAFQPVKDLLNKMRADIGLIVKASANIVRMGWELFAAIIRVPIVGVYAVLASPILIIQYLTSSEHYLPTPLEMNSALSLFFFAPGKISQIFNVLVGFFREAASAKNLELATRNITIQETRELQLFESKEKGRQLMDFLAPTPAADSTLQVMDSLSKPIETKTSHEEIKRQEKQASELDEFLALDSTTDSLFGTFFSKPSETQTKSVSENTSKTHVLKSQENKQPDEEILDHPLAIHLSSKG